MTNPTLTQIARGICKARGLDWDAQVNPMTSAGGGDDEQQGFIDDARAAVQALISNISEEMVEAGLCEVDKIGRYVTRGYIDNEDARVIFTAMLQSLLKGDEA